MGRCCTLCFLIITTFQIQSKFRDFNICETVLCPCVICSSSSHWSQRGRDLWVSPHDLELPLAPVCAHVTIMIRIDDRTLWFHCLAKGVRWRNLLNSERTSDFVISKWWVGIGFVIWLRALAVRLCATADLRWGQGKLARQGREFRHLKEKFSSGYPLGEG